MNKKFSTLLTTSLLMLGALFSSAQAQTSVDLGDKATEVSSGSMYYIVQQAAVANLAATSDYLMGMSKTGTTLAPLVVAAADNSGVGFTTGAGEEIENYLWTVTAADQEGGKYYTLKNVKTGAFLAVDKSNFAMITAAADAVEAKNVIRFSFGTDGSAAYESETGANLVPKGGAAANSLILADGSITFGTDNNKKVILYSVKTQPVAATDLNAAFGGAGFSFAPDGVEVEDNIFDQSIKAFDVEADIVLEASVRAIKKGTYFATSYPDELAEKSEIEQKDVEAGYFDACTFIAVSPTENFKTSKLPQSNGEGFKFTTVKGEDLNTYIAGDNVSSKEEVSVYNAAFTVTEPNEFASAGKYKMALTARVLADPKASSNKDQKHAAKNIQVIATAIQDVNYITTSSEGSLFKVASSKLVKAVSLLKEEKAPSVFNIQFVSGKGTKDSEYNKYMGVAIASGTDLQLVAQGSALAALNTPQYQFVISAIDTKTQTITFKNLETAVTFKSTLFETENDGEYKLVGVATEASTNLATIEVAKDDKSDYTANVSLEGKVITLNAVTVDPLAGFAVKDQTSETVILKFAKSAALNAEKLYIGVDEKTKTNTALFDKESKAIKVKFIPVEEADKPNGTAQTYCYNKDGKVYTANQKMVTYYSYSAQIIDGENNSSYLKIDNSDLKIEENVNNAASAATKFLIKENKDGSVSLFVSTAFANATNAKAVKSDDGTAISVDGIAYAVEDADAIKLYLVGEELGVSLEAKPRHAAFKSTTGGYISLSEKNEGVVAIKTAADADMTFCLDTADSKATVPSFYISRRGATPDAQRLYMFNVADSVDNVISDAKKAEYQWYADINKVIFKAATLVNSDTLSTTVNGKEALVATSADQNKGILGGLNNFKYQILKVADTDDEYYIRNMVEGDYLVSYNGLLTLGEKDKAIKVTIEKGESPVANDAISADAVSVTAGNGFVTVKGAEGKNVVITNVLGQIIANTVVSSSEATIAVSAGVVFVSVEGEAAVKAIVK
ncbi:DUF6383 domain-containing protein [uncultured Parabacteroides sp.]|uniref:DUF6383 domain-containing protein n=1 Tax=uncultured Parabacteroides sp. TaxID=512312 RepID=UPI00259BA9A0|nr:DUF6383 domain-containing protein [uncultured Parabacteroides sp.]